jgi:hypothetical protein
MSCVVKTLTLTIMGHRKHLIFSTPFSSPVDGEPGCSDQYGLRHSNNINVEAM